MSLTIFVAICVLGCDFMIFVFFKWAFGEKYGSRARRVAATVGSAIISGSEPTRPLRTYPCTAQPAGIENAKTSEPLSDLKCKNGDGQNVSLYVDKKE